MTQLRLVPPPLPALAPPAGPWADAAPAARARLLDLAHLCTLPGLREQHRRRSAGWQAHLARVEAGPDLSTREGVAEWTHQAMEDASRAVLAGDPHAARLPEEAPEAALLRTGDPGAHPGEDALHAQLGLLSDMAGEWAQALARRAQARARHADTLPGLARALRAGFPAPELARDRLSPPGERRLPEGPAVPRDALAQDPELVALVREHRAFDLPPALDPAHLPRPGDPVSAWMIERLVRAVTPGEWDAGWYTLARDTACRATSWAIPSEHALDAVLGHAGDREIVEMGAGTGLWAHLLAQEQQRRGETPRVTAYDTGEWRREARTRWHPVRRGGPERLALHPRSLLFVCWPPASDLGARCLRSWRGEHLALITDVWEPTDPAFLEQVARQFTLERVVDLPLWPGMHDQLTLWRR